MQSISCAINVLESSNFQRPLLAGSGHSKEVVIC